MLLLIKLYFPVFLISMKIPIKITFRYKQVRRTFRKQKEQFIDWSYFSKKIAIKTKRYPILERQ